MKPLKLASYDDERTKIAVEVPVTGRKQPVTVMLPRFDYIPEDKFDRLMDDLEALDVEQQVISAANDLTAVPVGEEVTWEPLIDEARARLEKLGVVVRKSMKQGQSRELLSAPDDTVLEALAPFASVKPKPMRKRTREIALVMLKSVVSEEQYEWFDALPSGALDELLSYWKSQSAITLGESAASPQN